MRKTLTNLLNTTNDFSLKGHVRSFEAKKNIIFSLGFKSISILINLVLVPLTINYVNPTQYGIWITMSSIMAWFSFFDIGLGNGLRNKFAESKALENYDKIRIYVSTTYAALLIIFSSVWILFFIANFFINWSHFLNTPAGMAVELSKVALILFSFVCMQFILKVITTILTADQKPAIPAFFDMISQLLILVIIVILTKFSHGSLLYLAVIIGSMPALVLLISSVWFYKGEYKTFMPSIRYVHFEYALDIMKLGLKFFIIQISIIAIYQTSNIIIARICGPESVSVYNIAYKYFTVIYFLFSIINAPFWSAFTDAYIQNDFEWMKSTIKKLELAAVLSVFAILILLMLSQVAYHLWVGDVIKIKFSLSVWVAIYFITNIFHALYTPILNGVGKIRLQLYVITTGALIYVPIAVFLGHRFGVEGVVMGTVLINLLILSYAPLQVHLIMRKKAKGIWNK